jgi:hypothetical protein
VPRVGEPEMERLVATLLTGQATTLEGASEAEIESLEALLSAPLPEFYRWFLSRMGRSMGPLRYDRLDFSIDRIISSIKESPEHATDELLLIGYGIDDMVPLHLYYDLRRPARHDALVMLGDDPEGPFDAQFETFREMVAWGKFAEHRVAKATQRCRGLVSTRGDGLMTSLRGCLDAMGFAPVAGIPTGELCGLFENAANSLVVSSTPDRDPTIHGFYAGGTSEASIRQVLGQIEERADLAIEVKEWTPPPRDALQR